MNQWFAYFRLCLTVLFCMTAGASLRAQTLTELASFPAFSYPSVLVGSPKAGLYGLTGGGGAYNQGSVFEFTPGGTLITLHSFRYSDGASPNSLIRLANGNLYGTTHGGGPENSGTVFELTPSGNLSTLDSLLGNPTAMILGTDGNFYGTTYFGGAHQSGSIFRVTPTGAFSTLYSLNSSVDGIGPNSLAQTSDGTLYGTTDLAGPDSPTGEAYGTVFEITLTGQFRTLYTFKSRYIGADPNGLLAGADGSLYGTTFYGGTSDLGTVFRITPSGSLTILHSFNTQDGDSPSGVLNLSRSNAVYGTTLGGGSPSEPNSSGTLFEIDSAGVFRLLYQFHSSPGADPFGVVQATGGSYYGVTQGGGASDGGLLYQLDIAR